MLLKEYKKLPWPRNLWSTVLCGEVSENELPEDWELTLEYVFEKCLDVKKAESLWHYFQKGMTFQEIGGIYGLTLEAVREQVGKAIRRMRHPSWRVFLVYGLEKGKAVLDEERTVAERQRRDGRSIEAADCPIEILDLSVRTFNCLKRAGISTVGQLSQYSEKDLARVRNLGAESLREIKDCLATIRGEGVEKAGEGREYPAGLVDREALMENIENIDWYSVSEEGVFHEGARNEEVAFVRYADVEAAIKEASAVQANSVVRARWEICIDTNTFDTYGKPDKYARCTHCGFRWGDLYSVKNYFKRCPGCGSKVEAYK